MRLRTPVQNQQGRELISARKTSHKQNKDFEDVDMSEFMYCVRACVRVRVCVCVIYSHAR